jgi:hypothetical protein
MLHFWLENPLLVSLKTLVDVHGWIIPYFMDRPIWSDYLLFYCWNGWFLMKDQFGVRSFPKGLALLLSEFIMEELLFLILVLGSMAHNSTLWKNINNHASLNLLLDHQILFCIIQIFSRSEMELTVKQNTLLSVIRCVNT